MNPENIKQNLEMFESKLNEYKQTLEWLMNSNEHLQNDELGLDAVAKINDFLKVFSPLSDSEKESYLISKLTENGDKTSSLVELLENRAVLLLKSWNFRDMIEIFEGDEKEGIWKQSQSKLIKLLPLADEIGVNATAFSDEEKLLAEKMKMSKLPQILGLINGNLVRVLTDLLTLFSIEEITEINSVKTDLMTYIDELNSVSENEKGTYQILIGKEDVEGNSLKTLHILRKIEFIKDLLKDKVKVLENLERKSELFDTLISVTGGVEYDWNLALKLAHYSN